ncbi:MAG: TonB-dependent receptor [Cyclobacteriaceae bacterium]|nr:TonB-dependent receptor [Cyclobacteriaceae bacterium]
MLNKKVSLHANPASVNEVLLEIAAQCDLSFRQINNTISVKIADRRRTEKEVEVVLQTTSITGKVSASDSPDGLPGVNVVVKGTTLGSVTDINGNYIIDVPGPETILVFSSVGYLTEEIRVGNRTSINVELAMDVTSLEEIVVIGYGTVKKSDLTGSVVSIRDEDLTAIPVTNALEVMQGKVPGLDLTKSSGQAGAGLNFTIRGNRSLNAGNQPLILVDGIIYGSTMDVNPNDIASIEVLKDAASTAIYGTLGANGVILITTKKGAEGKAKISLNSYYGVQTLGGYAHIMDGPEWVDLRREARRTVGEWNSPADDANIFNPTQLENFRNGIYTDWAQQLLSTGSQQNHQIGISGGANRVSYYFSLEYFNEKGLMRNDELDRYSGRFTVDYKLTDNIKLSTNLMYTIRDHDRRRDPLNQANKMSPLGPAFDEEGNVLTFPVGDASTLNPLNDEIPGNFVDNEMNRRFFGNISLDWTILQGLTFTSRLGVDNTTSRRGLFAATNTIEVGPQGQSLARINHSMFSRTTWENFMNYTKSLDKHDFQVLVGSSIWATNREDSFLEGRDVLSPTMLFHNMGATQDGFRLGSELIQTSIASVFTRFNYKFNNKYLFTGVLRADGSSVLAPGNKWGFFPSAAVSWIAKEEDFLRGVDALTELKFRLSYGVSGNSAVSPYQTLGGLSKSTYAFDRGAAEMGAFGFYPSLIAASDLSWETTGTTNFGIDFGLMNNRITGAIDIYQQDTRDLLMQRALPTTSGFASSWDNVGRTRNRGIEVLVSTINTDRPQGLRWTTDFTFGANREEIVELVTGDRDLANNWFVGHPIVSYYDYEKIGIWQLGEESLAAENQQLVGEIRVRDQDGNGVITPEDRTILGSNVPRFNLGVNNRLSYKNWDLTFFLFARVGQTIISEAAGSFKIDGLENGPMVDYWTPENPTNAYPRPNAGTSRASTRYYSTLQYVDGSFLKVRDITLGYNIPTAVTDRMSLNRVRIYTTAKNYFVWSHMGPYDPERGGNLSFPMTRQFVFGVNIDL